MNDKTKTGSIFLLFILSFVFIALKLFGVISFDWWLVTVLIWVPPVAVIFLIAFGLIIMGIFSYMDFLFRLITSGLEEGEMQENE